MTRKALLVTEDSNLRQFVEISAMTLTKLNCQVELISSFAFNECIKISGESNLDLILLDLGLSSFSAIDYIEKIRKSGNSKDKKIIAFSDEINNTDKNRIFSSGCDSIMSKDEIKLTINNLLQY